METSRREYHGQIKRLGKNLVKKGRKISLCKDGKWPTRMWNIWIVHILKDSYGCKVGASMEGRIFSRFLRNWGGVLIVLDFFGRERWLDFWKDTLDFLEERWLDFGGGILGLPWGKKTHKSRKWVITTKVLPGTFLVILGILTYIQSSIILWPFFNIRSLLISVDAKGHN